MQLLDVRAFVDVENDDERRPTKKGIAVKVERIPALIEALKMAEAEAKRRGLLNG